ncbi:MAG: hypothetical protein WBB85_21620, partial [Albidovulum sp.]|uniref:hypothetical protein n=1 Tax=Albidovulum sp. TaxID=1872424 RepID=UPI003C839F0D
QARCQSYAAAGHNRKYKTRLITPYLSDSAGIRFAATKADTAQKSVPCFLATDKTKTAPAKGAVPNLLPDPLRRLR